MINRLETLSLNAWPAEQNLLRGGWIVRRSRGYTKRANSVQPLTVPEEPLEEMHRWVESLWTQWRSRPVYKLTPAAPEGLDAFLETQGYELTDRTAVMTLPLETVSPGVPETVRLTDALTPEWHRLFCQWSGLDPVDQETLKLMLNLILPRHLFVTLEDQGAPVACGMVVLESGFAGLYEVLVDPARRGKGHGRRLMEALLSLCAQEGAHTAYLQVVQKNAAAMRLYESLGFTTAYEYWYRMRSDK